MTQSVTVVAVELTTVLPCEQSLYRSETDMKPLGRLAVNALMMFCATSKRVTKGSSHAALNTV